MLGKSSRTGWRLAVAAASALLGFTLGAAIDPLSGEEPAAGRCRIELVAYEDGSASLHCERERRALGKVDAESGRVQIAAPPTMHR